MKRAIKTAGQPRKPSIVDLWRRRVPLSMWLVGVDPGNARAKEREESRLNEAICSSKDTSPVAIAVKLHTLLDFAAPADFITDWPWPPLVSVVRGLLPQLPADLRAALRPFIVSERSRRIIDEAWQMGAKAAFPEAAKAVEKANGKAI